MHHFFAGDGAVSDVVFFLESTGVPISHVCHCPTTVVALCILFYDIVASEINSVVIPATKREKIERNIVWNLE